MKTLVAPLAIILARASALFADNAKPNVILIVADDLGYGDLSCYGSTKTKTPHIDKLAAQGIRFTDGHSTSATCTPSRYALLTGEYPWRKKGTGILPGDAALIIKPGSHTLPAVFKQAGYATAAIGKWHLGLGAGKIDWNTDIKPGPLEIGFDHCFLIPATVDRVPCVYVEDHRVANLDPSDPIQVSYGKKIGDEPTGKENPDQLKMGLTHGHDATIVNGISRIGFMTGGKKARWVDEDIADVIAAKASGFIEKNKDKPFFIYFNTHDVHVPRTPHARFKGTSGCGLRGDVVHEFDDTVGQILAALDKHKLAENTIVIVTSDNGPVLDDGYKDGAVADLNGHKPAGPLRGGKYSNFEAGTRVPFIVRWPARVKPGTSDALVCQVDFLASFSSLLGAKLRDDAAPDSHNVLPALLGESKTGREHLVEHASQLSLRVGSWKFIPSTKGPAKAGATNNETGNVDGGQLYDLSKDLGETKNLIKEEAERAKEMATRLEKLRSDGRSR